MPQWRPGHREGSSGTLRISPLDVKWRGTWRISQTVRRQSAKLAVPCSNHGFASKTWAGSRVVRHTTFNRGTAGSIPARPTNN